MAGFYGADVDELDRLAEDLRSGAERLRAHRGLVRQIVHASAWDGDDAERFKVDFDTRVGPSIGACADLLESAANAIRTNAEEQRAASTQGSGSGAIDPRGGGSYPYGPGAARRSVDQLPPEFMDLVFEGIGSGGTILDAASLIENTPGSRVMPFVGAGATGLQVAFQGSEYGWGDARTMETMIFGGVGSALGFVPGVGTAMSLAWTGATMTGEWIYGGGDHVVTAVTGKGISDLVYDDYVYQRWGVRDISEVDPATGQAIANEMVDRYYGWSGLMNSTLDTQDSFWNWVYGTGRK